MKKIIKLSLMFVLFILFASFLATSIDSDFEFQKNEEQINIYYFWGEGCPACAIQEPKLNEINEKYEQVILNKFEVYGVQKNQELFEKIANIYGTSVQGVPTTFIGERYWVGVSEEIERYVVHCIEEGCEDLVIKSKIDDEKENYEEKFEENNEQEEKFEESKEDLCLHLFISEDCPQCLNVITKLEEISEEYNLKIEVYDVSFKGNKTLYYEFKELYGLETEMYPIVFVGESYLLGESPIIKGIESKVQKCLQEGCICPFSKIKPYTPISPTQEDVTYQEQNINFLGMEIEISSMPLFFSTFLISFVDGFNPCSLFVLMFLLSIVVLTGSRKKIFLIGFTYLAVAALVYGLFILMVFNIFLYIGYLTWIKVMVATVAFIFAAVNIKDFFWYKKGISFTIPDSYKPKLYKKVRDLMKHDGSFWGLIVGSALLALGITLVELPCTAGLPWIWSSMIAQYELNFVSYALLFMTYILVYFSIELSIFLIAVFTLQISKFEEKHGRTLKLIGGLIMAMLGFVLLYDHTLMEDIGTTILLFGGTIGLGVLISWIYSKSGGFEKSKIDESSKVEKENKMNDEKGEENKNNEFGKMKEENEEGEQNKDDKKDESDEGSRVEEKRKNEESEGNNDKINKEEVTSNEEEINELKNRRENE